MKGESLRVTKGNPSGIVENETVGEGMRLRRRGFDIDRAENRGVELFQLLRLDVEVRRKTMPDKQAASGRRRIWIDRIIESRVQTIARVSTADLRGSEQPLDDEDEEHQH